MVSKVEIAQNAVDIINEIVAKVVDKYNGNFDNSNEMSFEDSVLVSRKPFGGDLGMQSDEDYTDPEDSKLDFNKSWNKAEKKQKNDSNMSESSESMATCSNYSCDYSDFKSASSSISIDCMLDFRVSILKNSNHLEQHTNKKKVVDNLFEGDIENLIDMNKVQILSSIPTEMTMRSSTPKQLDPWPMQNEEETITELKRTNLGLIDLDFMFPCSRENPCLLDKLIYKEYIEYKNPEKHNFGFSHNFPKKMFG